MYRNIYRIGSLLAGLCLVLLVFGCGAATDMGAGMESATPHFTPDGDNRQVSSTFSKFFADSISSNSKYRWTTQNDAGSKKWLCTDIAHDGNECWAFGRNYWKGEHDSLTSQVFNVPGGRKEIRLAFYVLHNMQPGAQMLVQYRTSVLGSWTTLDTLTGANASFPQSDRLCYQLADTVLDSQYQLRYVFDSDMSGMGWGCALDKVSVYQTNLDAPTNLDVLQVGLFSLQVSWSAPAGGMHPGDYRILRSSLLGGPFVEVGSVPGNEVDPTFSYTDNSGSLLGLYFYKVVSGRDGYPDSPDSAASLGVQLLP